MRETPCASTTHRNGASPFNLQDSVSANDGDTSLECPNPALLDCERLLGSDHPLTSAVRWNLDRKGALVGAWTTFTFHMG